MPSTGDTTSFSSFIASISNKHCPFLTESPTFTFKATTFPVIGAGTTVELPEIGAAATGALASLAIEALFSLTASNSTSYNFPLTLTYYLTSLTLIKRTSFLISLW